MSDSSAYKPLPKDLVQVIAALRYHVDLAEKNSKDYAARHFNGIQEETLVYCLVNATDIARACLLLCESKLPGALVILSRALLETLIWARYVTISMECAQAFSDAAGEELRRTARRNLAAKFARVVDRKTGEDRTAEVLDSPLLSKIPRRLSLEDAARAGGLIRLYSAIYGFISIYAHGKAFGFSENPDLDNELYLSMCSALGALECTNVIASDWIVDRKQTDQDILWRLLGLRPAA
jgi:hypothetical protein